MTPEQLSQGGQFVSIHGPSATILGKIAAVLVMADDADLKLYRQTFASEGSPTEVTDLHYRDGATPKDGDYVTGKRAYQFARVDTGAAGRVAILWAEKPAFVV